MLISEADVNEEYAHLVWLSLRMCCYRCCWWQPSQSSAVMVCLDELLPIIRFNWINNEVNLTYLCSSSLTSSDRTRARSSVSAAAWPHARSIAETADVRYTRAAPIQVKTLRSITRTTNQRPYKWTAVASFAVNTNNHLAAPLASHTWYRMQGCVVHRGR